MCTSIVAERRARAQDESEVSSNFAKLVEAWKICTPEEQRRLLNQNNAIILTGGEGLLLIREFYAAALRDSDRQTRIRELRALLTAFDLTAHDLFLPADVERVDPAPAPRERRAQRQEPAQNGAASPTDNLDGIPSFLDRREPAPASAAEPGSETVPDPGTAATPTAELPASNAFLTALQAN